jgi:hypothetical protein
MLYKTFEILVHQFSSDSQGDVWIHLDTFTSLWLKVSLKKCLAGLTYKMLSVSCAQERNKKIILIYDLLVKKACSKIPSSPCPGVVVPADHYKFESLYIITVYVKSNNFSPSTCLGKQLYKP